jgi:hypothetical protein
MAALIRPCCLRKEKVVPSQYHQLTASQRAEDWVRRHSPTHSKADRLVLWETAKWTQEDGTAQVPVAVLAADTALDERTVRRSIARLVAAGCLWSSDTNGRGRQVNIYRIQVPEHYNPADDGWNAESQRWENRASCPHSSEKTGQSARIPMGENRAACPHSVHQDEQETGHLGQKTGHPVPENRAGCPPTSITSKEPLAAAAAISSSSTNGNGRRPVADSDWPEEDDWSDEDWSDEEIIALPVVDESDFRIADIHTDADGIIWRKCESCRGTGQYDDGCTWGGDCEACVGSGRVVIRRAGVKPKAAKEANGDATSDVVPVHPFTANQKLPRGLLILAGRRKLKAEGRAGGDGLAVTIGKDDFGEELSRLIAAHPDWSATELVAALVTEPPPKTITYGGTW